MTKLKESALRRIGGRDKVGPGSGGAGTSGPVTVDGVTVFGNGVGVPLNAPGTQIQSVPVNVIDATEDLLGPELLINGDFEDGTTGWAGLSGATIGTLPDGAGGFELSVSILVGDGIGDASQNTVQAGVENNTKLQARGDGANGIPRVRVDGVAIWTGTNSTDWQDVDETYLASGVAYSLVVLGDLSTNDTAYFRNVSNKEVRTIANTDKKLNIISKENKLLYSEDFTNAIWTKSNINISSDTGLFDIDGNEYLSMAATDPLLQAFIRQTISQSVAELITYHARVRHGDVEWCYFQDQFSGRFIYFDLKNLIAGSSSGIDAYKIVKNNAEDVDIYIQHRAGNATGRFQISPAEANGDIAISTADGVKINMFLSFAHVYDGTIGDNIEYVETTAVTSSEQIIQFSPDLLKKWENGTLEKQDAPGNFEPTTTPFGYNRPFEQLSEALYTCKCIKAHRTVIDNTITTLAWTDCSSFAEISEETFGDVITLNADNKTFDVLQDGLYQFGGCVHVQNNSAGVIADLTILIRLVQNGTEIRCSQRGLVQNVNASGELVLSYNGTARLSAGDEILLQYYTDSSDIEFFSNVNFDNQVAYTFWATRCGD